MKNISKSFLLFNCFILFFSACEFDENIDPNLPKSVDKNLILTAAQGSFATVLGGELTNYGGFMAQYHTQAPGATQYINIDSYNISPNYTNRIWQEVFAGGMSDLDFVAEQSLIKNDNGTYLIAKLLKAYMYQVMTDLYGDIPYSEILPGANNLNPVPIKQEIIYESLISSIDKALTIYQANPNGSTANEQDVIFNGNMEHWIQFANTLKLKIYMRLAYTSKANSTAILALIAQDNFITEDVKFDIYIDENDRRNPFVDAQFNFLGDVNHIASNSLLEFYKNHNDPRLAKVYRIDFQGNYSGIDQGDRGNFVGFFPDDFSRPNLTPEKPVFFMTLAESKFLQAEALIRYNAETGAQIKYEEGIRQSFINYGFTATEAENFITGDYAYVSNIDTETTVRQVMIQKWAALAYVNNIEAYFEQVRTGFPEFVTTAPDYSIGNLSISKTSVLPPGQTPKSVFYPDTEVNTNQNINQKNTITEKVWWDQKN